MRITKVLVAAAMAAVSLAGCNAAPDAAATNGSQAQATIPVTIATADGKKHIFNAERAVTQAEQSKGLMYRTDLGPQFGMLFWPYPAEGPPRVASFWMQNTPTSLDIIYIRADGTIESIAENTVPFSTAPIESGEPVAAVLEVVAGRAAALGIEEGDRVSWPGGPAAG